MEEKDNNNKINKKLILGITIIVIVIIGAIGINSLSKDPKGGTMFSNNEEVNIVESKAKTVKLTDFDNGLISLKIPEGWKVDVLGDYIHYTIKAYDPEDTNYQFFFNMKTEGYNKSQAAKKFQQRFYPNSMFAKTSVIEEKTTEGFYKIFNDLGTLNNTATFTFPTLSDFKVSEKIGTSALGGDILRATYKNEDQKEGEGLFTAYVYDAGSYYMYENGFSGKKIDTYYLNVYNTMFITAPKDEFINWEEILNKMVASLNFSDTFVSQYYNQQDSVMKTFQSVRNICNQISDGIMSSWEARNKSYDRMSQKQSDAILGYERVYNTDTGEIYKAYNGFTDDYKGNRYQSISDDMYSESISGYIEKK